MTTKQINIRLSEPGQRLLADLVELYGSQTKAIEVAIDRLHQQECAHKCESSRHEIEARDDHR